MDRAFRRFRVVLVTGLVTLGLTAFAGSVSAASGPTPNGFTGACNMLAAVSTLGPAQGVGVQPGGGMENAMTVNNPNGNLGMWRAVDVSGCS